LVIPASQRSPSARADPRVVWLQPEAALSGTGRRSPRALPASRSLFDIRPTRRTAGRPGPGLDSCLLASAVRGGRNSGSRVLAQRKPTLLLRLVGVLLLRYAPRKLSALSLFHEPPRNTREAPSARPFGRSLSNPGLRVKTFVAHGLTGQLHRYPYGRESRFLQKISRPMTNDEAPNDEGNPNDEIPKSQSVNRAHVAAGRHTDSSAVFRRMASRPVRTTAGHSDFDIRASLGFGYFVIRHSA